MTYIKKVNKQEFATSFTHQNFLLRNSPKFLSAKNLCCMALSFPCINKLKRHPGENNQDMVLQEFLHIMVCNLVPTNYRQLLLYNLPVKPFIYSLFWLILISDATSVCTIFRCLRYQLPCCQSYASNNNTAKDTCFRTFMFCTPLHLLVCRVPF